MESNNSSNNTNNNCFNYENKQVANQLPDFVLMLSSDRFLTWDENIKHH